MQKELYMIRIQINIYIKYIIIYQYLAINKETNKTMCQNKHI